MQNHLLRIQKSKSKHFPSKIKRPNSYELIDHMTGVGSHMTDHVIVTETHIMLRDHPDTICLSFPPLTPRTNIIPDTPPFIIRGPPFQCPLNHMATPSPHPHATLVVVTRTIWIGDVKKANGLKKMTKT